MENVRQFVYENKLLLGVKFTYTELKNVINNMGFPISVDTLSRFHKHSSKPNTASERAIRAWINREISKRLRSIGFGFVVWNTNM
jgi:hypothetical protein